MDMKHIIPILAAMLCLAACGAQHGIVRGESLKTDGYTKNQTSAISHLEMNDTDAMTYRTLEEYLEGRVAGLEIGPDGGIVIRGKGTFNGSSAPLIIVDGVEVMSTDAVNPADIYSVDVLKDAGSTALYGIRGANGVILITTKGGRYAREAEREARKQEKATRKTGRKK